MINRGTNLMCVYHLTSFLVLLIRNDEFKRDIYLITNVYSILLTKQVVFVHSIFAHPPTYTVVSHGAISFIEQIITIIKLTEIQLRHLTENSELPGMSRHIMRLH